MGGCREEDLRRGEEMALSEVLKNGYLLHGEELQHRRPARSELERTSLRRRAGARGFHSLKKKRKEQKAPERRDGSRKKAGLYATVEDSRRRCLL